MWSRWNFLWHVTADTGVITCTILHFPLLKAVWYKKIIKAKNIFWLFIEFMTISTSCFFFNLKYEMIEHSSTLPLGLSSSMATMVAGGPERESLHSERIKNSQDKITLIPPWCFFYSSSHLLCKKKKRWYKTLLGTLWVGLFDKRLVFL